MQVICSLKLAAIIRTGLLCPRNFVYLPTNFGLLSRKKVLCQGRRLKLILVERQVVDDHRLQVCATKFHVRVRRTLRQRRRIHVGPKRFRQRPKPDGETFLRGPGHEDQSAAVVPGRVRRRQDRVWSVRSRGVGPAAPVQVFAEVEASYVEYIFLF